MTDNEAVELTPSAALVDAYDYLKSSCDLMDYITYAIAALRGEAEFYAKPDIAISYDEFNFTIPITDLDADTINILHRDMAKKAQTCLMGQLSRASTLLDKVQTFLGQLDIDDEASANDESLNE